MQTEDLYFTNTQNMQQNTNENKVQNKNIKLYNIYDTLTNFELSLYSFAAWFSIFDLLHAEIFHDVDEPRQKRTMLSHINSHAISHSELCRQL